MPQLDPQRPRLRPRTVDLYSWLLTRHIAPHLGGVPIGKLSTPMIREWRASFSAMASQSRWRPRLPAAARGPDDRGRGRQDPARNPCRIRGAGTRTAERPVLTVAQVFALAERVGRRPVGNIRQLPAGGYRLRFRRQGVMRTSPEALRERADAERALWEMAEEGRADCVYRPAVPASCCWPPSPACAGAR